MEKQIANKGITGRKVLNTFIILFCSIVVVTIIYVLLFKFNPKNSSAGAIGSACMDIICMVILFVLVLSLTFDKEMQGRTTKIFLALVLGTKWAVFFDFLTWSLDGDLVYGGWTFAFTLASLCSGSILGAVFSLYLGSYMHDMYGLKNLLIRSRVCMVINIVSFILTVTLALTLNAFEFVDGHYTTGALYDVITVLPILTLIYMVAYTVRNVKCIGAHDVVIVVIYIVVMMFGAILEAIFGIGTTYVCVSVADVFIFVMLQNKVIDREKKQKEILKQKVEKWKEKSNTDEVTGFYNRHAYEEEMALLEETKDDEIVYISMDVNGLKVVNDNLGHGAGDELLIGACECMKRCFEEYGKLFRIGGDEFVALIRADASVMLELMNRFDEAVESWHGEQVDSLTVSYGYVFRNETKDNSLHEMAVLADKRMYESKRKFYQKKGVDRRGQKDAHVALCGLYSKILSINLTDDSYVVVSMNAEDYTTEKGFSKKLSEWITGFAKSGEVHPDDLEEYLSRTSLEYIDYYFRENSEPLRIFYRRRIDDVYRKTMMEIIPSNEYSPDNKKLFLYVKDIDF